MNLAFGSILIFLYLSGTAADNNSLVFPRISFVEGPNITKPGCPRKCGDLTVPYPFGIRENPGCSMNPFFDINCNTSSNPPKPFFSNAKLEVLGISETKIRVKNRLSVQCFNQFGELYMFNPFVVNLTSSPFSFSKENDLTVVGCDDTAFLSSTEDSVYGLISSCRGICSKHGELNNGFCSGIGCSHSSIPEGLQFAIISMTTDLGHIKVHGFSSCGYSFLAERSSYTFNISDLSNSSFASRVEETVPIVIDWVIGTGTCNQTRNNSEIICNQNSVCVDTESTLGGYGCICSQGYQGNPYLSPGCQDINECDTKPCHQDATCTNLPGSFSCSCRLNYIGDGTIHGIGCIYVTVSLPGMVVLYTGLMGDLGLVFILVLGFWLYKLLKKRRIKQLEQNLFKRKGSLLLQNQMSAQDCVLEKMRIFTSKELEKATDQFNRSLIVGRGGQGTVYKGMLPDGRTIAVKKSEQANQNQLQDVINEVVIGSQISHRNVVELLGCCLETEVPLLVYEFVPNGTLYHLIHDQNTEIPFSWDVRLRMAAEIGNALSHLHNATSVPIYHRDMKSTNILLDEEYRAKLSDFGISRSVKMDQTHLTTKVKGTFGYLDPEYFQTGQFTEKSDVYSFGVVLVELLTGQKPIATDTTEVEEERSLVSLFLLAMEENRVNTILDSRISEQGDKPKVTAVSDLAKRCLNLKGKKRPNIREVVMELESIRTSEGSFFVESCARDSSEREAGDSPQLTQNIDCICETDPSLSGDFWVQLIQLYFYCSYNSH